MNHPIARKPLAHPSFHIVSTLMVGIVCVACLAAAGTGLYANKYVRADICSLVFQQLWAVQTMTQNDGGLVPKGIKKTAWQITEMGIDILADHCPVESITPP